MFGIEKDFQNLMEQVYGPLNKDKMTKEVDISKVLIEGDTATIMGVKYQRVEEPKSPVEEAYKDWWGQYPETGTWDGYDEKRWQGFQAGYYVAHQEKVSETAQERGEQVSFIKELVKDGIKWCEEHPNESVEDWLKPQTHQQVADGLKEAFREAVKQGVVSSTKSPTLYDLIYDWSDNVFTTLSELETKTCIDDLVDRIKYWLPKEQSAAGSQNVYVECTVEGFNDCLNKIKRKLR